MNVMTFNRVLGAFVGLALGLGSVITAAAQTPKPSSVATTAYGTVALSAATQPRSFFYVNPPASPLTAAGVPFTLGNAYWLHFGDQPAALTMNYDKPLTVYLLLNTSYTDAAFASQTVGSVRLTFSDGSVQDTALVVGANIREWEFGFPGTANTLSSPATVSVWQGMAQAAVGGASATMDMIPVDATSTTANLTGVTVSITYNSHMGIVYQGLTVAYDPWHRPGHSWDTPAATRSQAPIHAQSTNFTGVDPDHAAARQGHRHSVYVVVRGDTLWGIARREGVTLQALLKANPQVKNRNLIRVGERIRIP